MGMLLKEIVAAKNQHDVIARGSESPSRKQAFRDAGLFEDQGKEALRVASIPKKVFDQHVESDNVPSITTLADMGLLLKSIAPSKGGRPSETRDGADPSFRAQIATDAGLSERKRKDALRVASINPDEFERAIEAEEVPSILLKPIPVPIVVSSLPIRFVANHAIG